MSAKKRSARREARALNQEVLVLRERMRSLESEKFVLAHRLDASMRANARLSAAEMRARLVRDGQRLMLSVEVSEYMAREIYRERDEWAHVLGRQIIFEMERKALERDGIERPFYGDLR